MPALCPFSALFAGGGSETVMVEQVVADGEIVAARGSRADEDGTEEERGVCGLGQTSSCTSTGRYRQIRLGVTARRRNNWVL